MENWLIALFSSLSGILAAVISGIITYNVSKNQFRNDLSLQKASIEAEIQKQKESFVLEKSNNAVKMHLEKKYKIYEDICSSLIDAVIETNPLFPDGFEHPIRDDKDAELNRLKSIYAVAAKATNIASLSLHKNAAFISKVLFEKVNDILRLCRLQLFYFGEFRIKEVEFEKDKESIKKESECWIRTREIFDDTMSFLDYLRKEIDQEENKCV